MKETFLVRHTDYVSNLQLIAAFRVLIWPSALSLILGYKTYGVNLV